MTPGDQSCFGKFAGGPRLLVHPFLIACLSCSPDPQPPGVAFRGGKCLPGASSFSPFRPGLLPSSHSPPPPSPPHPFSPILLSPLPFSSPLPLPSFLFFSSPFLSHLFPHLPLLPPPPPPPLLPPPLLSSLPRPPPNPLLLSSPFLPSQWQLNLGSCMV